MFRGQPRPRGELLGPVEAGDVADLGDEHRGQHPPDAGDLLDRAVAGVGAQPAVDQLGEQLDLELQRADDPQRGVQPGPGLDRQPLARRQFGQQLPARDTEQVAHRHPDARVREHAVDLALQARAQPDQLGPMPHPPPQLPGRGWGDPRLGQAAHAQQIGQIRGVTLVVLHPPVGEHLHPERMRQVHGGAELGEGVRGPIPAVRGFEHHLGCLPGAGHHRLQVLRVVGDPYRFQLLAGVGHAHQHAAAAVQIHPDNLAACVMFAHEGPPRIDGVSTPSMSRGSRGAEAPPLSWHQRPRSDFWHPTRTPADPFRSPRYSARPLLEHLYSP